MNQASGFAHHTMALESVTLHYVSAGSAIRWYCSMVGPNLVRMAPCHARIGATVYSNRAGYARPRGFFPACLRIDKRTIALDPPLTLFDESSALEALITTCHPGASQSACE